MGEVERCWRCKCGWVAEEPVAAFLFLCLPCSVRVQQEIDRVLKRVHSHPPDIPDPTDGGERVAA